MVDQQYGNVQSVGEVDERRDEADDLRVVVLVADLPVPGQRVQQDERDPVLADELTDRRQRRRAERAGVDEHRVSRRHAELFESRSHVARVLLHREDEDGPLPRGTSEEGPPLRHGNSQRIPECGLADLHVRRQEGEAADGQKALAQQRPHQGRAFPDVVPWADGRRITTKEIEDFRATIGAERTAATVNHYLKFLKAAFNRAIRQGRLAFNPIAPMRLQREHNARNRCLSQDEEARLMAALPGRLRALVTVAMHTGMRQGELRALRWADVDFETAAIRIAHDKAGDGRWVAMNSVTREALIAAKREARVLGPYVFASPEGRFLHNFERYWRPAVTAASIPRLPLP